MSKGRLEGKVALVTGGASGIGEATVRLFAANGAVVVIGDIQDELGARVAASIGSGGCIYRHCDVREEHQVADTVASIVERYGRLDVLFSNAGIMESPASILEMDIDQLDSVMATNVRGSAAMIKHAARAMVAAKIRGSIICTASVAAGLGGLAPHSYTASKHAVLGLVRSASSELGKYGIRVNCVSPSGVATPLACRPVGVTPEELEAACSAVSNLQGVVLKAAHVGEAVLFLASDESSFISGHNLCLDGGLSAVNHVFSVFK
ncbi:unnamed protein product [Victoria cruziana]